MRKASAEEPCRTCRFLSIRTSNTAPPFFEQSAAFNNGPTAFSSQSPAANSSTISKNRAYLSSPIRTKLCRKTLSPVRTARLHTQLPNSFRAQLLYNNGGGGDGNVNGDGGCGEVMVEEVGVVVVVAVGVRCGGGGDDSDGGGGGGGSGGCRGSDGDDVGGGCGGSNDDDCGGGGSGGGGKDLS
ncbi:hypothetical protein L3X38_003511 [Prunus dulcis]|uniref:Uncharacterized protein n=1 Tax=Prunus dulcis TaxID=3755 RepID=A0AAD4ZM78_PRUDU|nr:hypothetical protein L3X38_003511 [Prunus dulcis]